MGIEGGSSNNEVQNQEINQANNEQIEQNQAEHQRSGSELEGNSTIDNEGERKQIEGKDDATEFTEGKSSNLDNDDKIEAEPSQENQSDMDMSEQQLDNQNVIEGENSLADGSVDDEKEVVDSLDTDDSIEDDINGLDEENVKPSDALDHDDTIESEDDSGKDKVEDTSLDDDYKIDNDKESDKSKESIGAEDESKKTEADNDVNRESEKSEETSVTDEGLKKSEGADDSNKESDKDLSHSDMTEDVDATDDKTKSREGELWEEQGEMAKDAFDSAGALVEKDRYGNDYKPLSREEAKELSDKLKSQIDEVPKGEAGNYRVPEPEKIKGVSVSDKGDVRIAENWKDGTDGAKPGTRHMETVKAVGEDGKPTVLDRVGGENGNYFSPMNPEGEPYSLQERAIGDYLPNERIQDNDSYHQYEVKQDFTRENFEKAINDTYDDPDVREEKMDMLNAYYNDASSDAYTNGHDGERYYDGTPDQAGGVKTGEIDQMFLEDGDEYGKGTDGGGVQYITPFSARELKEMGMIEEI